MKNRICPSIEVLSGYLAGSLAGDEKIAMERHLTGCPRCRQLLVETYEIMSSRGIHKRCKKWLDLAVKNRWFMGAQAALILSFFFPAYFVQFLTACFLMGCKWIIDAKTTKMLIMIHEAWKRGEKTELDKELSGFKHFMF
ncbi:MAG: zf-HC2 domain-containing protein [Candidatus Omnitrophica bacterium]|nr:zf-HC2 domain-containing protein [Candidatus Omnitrophota bacterium]MBU1127718.1 zf-HC2 domain-containing protein [Candidatus Omnitrophota bacterium]MBU1656613.1 zf-HC2 domain-containing protein [Candidatus Omnitrophota bacterium]MBU1784125.1 zf-HC2 domain-containing protein [Candidatus Omnitrophota bacterium]MBU1850807.1 zf-HC2 domain-containing protein [Candidatus Omnitrophota bacterium]